MSVEDREKIAREAGWIPEGEWDEKKTPPKSFKTADEFLDDAPMMLLSTRKAVSKLESQLKETNEKLSQTITDSRANNALVKRIHKRELREQEREILSRKRDKAEAIAEGDVEAGIAADRDIALLEADFEVVGANTDAVNVYVPDERWQEYLSICKEWEELTKMSLDHDEFTAIYGNAT